MKLLTSPFTRTTLRRRTHAFARRADVGSHPCLNVAFAIALLILTFATSSSIKVVAQTAVAAFTLPENIPDFSQDTSQPNVRSEVVFNRRDAIAIICLAVWL